MSVRVFAWRRVWYEIYLEGPHSFPAGCHPRSYLQRDWNQWKNSIQSTAPRGLRSYRLRQALQEVRPDSHQWSNHQRLSVRGWSVGDSRTWRYRQDQDQNHQGCRHRRVRRAWRDTEHVLRCAVLRRARWRSFREAVCAIAWGDEADG